MQPAKLELLVPLHSRVSQEVSHLIEEECFLRKVRQIAYVGDFLFAACRLHCYRRGHLPAGMEIIRALRGACFRGQAGCLGLPPQQSFHFKFDKR